jgi:hypothetical protein
MNQLLPNYHLVRSVGPSNAERKAFFEARCTEHDQIEHAITSWRGKPIERNIAAAHAHNPCGIPFYNAFQRLAKLRERALLLIVPSNSQLAIIQTLTTTNCLGHVYVIKI